MGGLSCAIFYINLDHRCDRRSHIESELQRLGAPRALVHRIAGVYQPQRGHLGCALSHVRALQSFQTSGAKHGLIFEDDFAFVSNIATAQQSLQAFFAQPLSYDVVMLAGKIISSSPGPTPFLHRVEEAQTTSGYMVSQNFARQLLGLFVKASTLLDRAYRTTPDLVPQLCIDQYWKRLQPDHAWYHFYPKLGKQICTFSDIEQRVTNYGN
jgi:hypothetical protein